MAEENPDSETLALSHVFGEPVSVELSSGDVVLLHSVPPRAMFRIAVQRERLQHAIAQYRAFQAIAEDPETRIWQKYRRVPYWQHRWIGELHRTCLMMIVESAAPRTRGLLRPLRLWLHRRRINRILCRATHQDLAQVASLYRKMNDMDALILAVFGPDDKPATDTEKKTLPQKSGQAS